MAQRKSIQLGNELDEDDENIHQVKYLTNKANKLIEEVEKIIIHNNEDLNHEENIQAEAIVDSANKILKKLNKKMKNIDSIKSKEQVERRVEAEATKVSRSLIVNEDLPIIKGPLEFKKWEKAIKIKMSATAKSPGGR